MATLAPPIVHDPIPFGTQRIAETRRYAVRHYGLHRARLIAPKVIVEYGITNNNVIGHAESLSSPYHRENVARLKTQTHGDWPRRFMVKYRRELAAG